MPFLEQDTLLNEVDGERYVLIFGKVFFADAFLGDGVEHSQLVYQAARELGVQENQVKIDGRGKPLVEAAGVITNEKEKFAFSIMTSSCKLTKSNKEAEKTVKEVAGNILGRERVF